MMLASCDASAWPRGAFGASATHLSARRRGSQRGLTLIEVLIVVAIGAVLAGGMAFANGQVQRGRLRGSATRVAAAMRAAFQRASSTGRRLRLVIDLDERSLWLEESEGRMLVQKDDPYGTGGADPATAAEKAAEAEGKRVLAGLQTPRAAFEAVAGPAGVAQPLYGGVTVRGVDVPHETTLRTSGRAYIYFFPSEAERASVQLGLIADNEPESGFSVVLAPLSGKATIVPGTVAIPRPKDDSEASEASDDGR